MFFGWVRLFVCHFLGKRNLEVYTAQLARAELNKLHEIKIFAVNTELYRVPDWNEFVTIIQKALKDTPVNDVTTIIETLRDRVTTILCTCTPRQW
jgi:hypothetical protein